MFADGAREIFETKDEESRGQTSVTVIFRQSTEETRGPAERRFLGTLEHDLKLNFEVEKINSKVTTDTNRFRFPCFGRKTSDPSAPCSDIRQILGCRIVILFSRETVVVRLTELS